MLQTGISIHDCRAALQKVLDSEYFSGSRRRSELFTYAATAALEGRTNIDQYEIAEKVLGLKNFDPLDDASVRKLATQLRHKLDEYYAGPGASDSIVISLPRHSYVPRFRYRSDVVAPEPEIPVEAEAEIPATHERRLPPKALWMLTGICVGAAPFCVWLLFRATPPADASRASVVQNRIVIQTQQGDIRGKDMDVAPGAVRLGPPIADGEEATVRLRFASRHPTQQAGIMAMYDADNYVRLGSQFKNRTLMEFGLEQNGVFDQGPSSTYAFDPLGQTGLARWLSVRRNGDDYSAYVSSDGLNWAPFGGKVRLSSKGKDPRAAIYAFNGRSSNPSVTAVFDDFGTGISFHSRPAGAFHVSEFAGWEEKIRCGPPVEVNVANGALEIGFTKDAVGCRWTLTKAAPAGDWAFSTFLDFEPVSGSSLGLIVQGSKESIALSRRDLDGRTLLLQRSDDRDVHIPDFPGAPPVILRVEKKGTLIRASVSCDGERFVAIPADVRMSDLGTNPRIGVSSSIAHWASPVSRPAARIYWMRTESLALGDLTAGIVPPRNGT